MTAYDIIYDKLWQSMKTPHPKFIQGGCMKGDWADKLVFNPLSQGRKPLIGISKGDEGIIWENITL